MGWCVGMTVCLGVGALHPEAYFRDPLTNRVSAASHQVLHARICVMHPALQVLYTRVE
jgi:hypothetical protein